MIYCTYKNESCLYREYGCQKHLSCTFTPHRANCFSTKSVEPAIIFPAFVLRILVSSELVFPSLLILLMKLFRTRWKRRSNVFYIYTYEPILLQDSDSDPEGTQDVPIISYQAALEGLEALRLFRLQNSHAGCIPSDCYHGVF